MHKQKTLFPRYLDRPKMIGVFEIDEAFVGMGIFMVIFFFGFFFMLDAGLTMGIGFIAMFSTAYGVKKFKKSFPDNFIYHLVYKLGYFHPVTDNQKLKLTREDIKNGSKILPTGYIKHFFE
jgi:type IV conjugative transfer system protein TraL